MLDTHYDQNATTLLGSLQMRILKKWLLKVKDTMTFKFLMSPGPWTLNYRAGHGAWADVPDEVYIYTTYSKIVKYIAQ